MRDEDFWRFSTRIYRLDRVADSCLALQDRFGVDVNMMLFCCWSGVTIGRLPTSSVRTAAAFSLGEVSAPRRRSDSSARR